VEFRGRRRFRAGRRVCLLRVRPRTGSRRGQVELRGRRRLVRRRFRVLPVRRPPRLLCLAMPVTLPTPRPARPSRRGVRGVRRALRLRRVRRGCRARGRGVRLRRPGPVRRVRPRAGMCRRSLCRSSVRTGLREDEDLRGPVRPARLRGLVLRGSPVRPGGRMLRAVSITPRPCCRDRRSGVLARPSRRAPRGLQAPRVLLVRRTLPVVRPPALFITPRPCFRVRRSGGLAHRRPRTPPACPRARPSLCRVSRGQVSLCRVSPSPVSPCRVSRGTPVSSPRLTAIRRRVSRLSGPGIRPYCGIARRTVPSSS
jgi:hypothetical protein